jgi:hypothetical protein
MSKLVRDDHAEELRQGPARGAGCIAETVVEHIRDFAAAFRRHGGHADRVFRPAPARDHRAIQDIDREILQPA